MSFLVDFQCMVSKYPDQTAIADYNGERITTYRELDILSRKVAAKLGQAGDMTGKAVMVCMGRRMEFIAAEIGILMSGAAFVPVLPEYPKERLKFIQEDCQAAVVIDENWMADIQAYAPAEPVGVADESRAMIIYTSGSTGKPKGIVHSMASLTQATVRNRKALNMSADDIQGAAAPLSFVVIVFEYFSVLSCGACVHILPEEVRKDVHLMEDYFAEHGITCAFISPQMMRYFKNKGTALKKIATGSERVSMLAGDGYELFNYYGSSETASIASYYKISTPMENTPIGKPAEGLEFFLLDEEGREVAEGEDGELCIRGILADGYLNLEEKTAQTFTKQEDGTVLLHTGDIARKLADGNYVYVNRKDWMVKINGQRVETGEIELRMASMPEIENAVVKAFEDENGQNYLCGYYVSGQEVASGKIRAFLREWLPGYMVPRFFKRLDSLPKNVNGKLDRTVLLPPGIEEYKTAYREPESDTERRICQGFEDVLHCGAVGLDDDFFMLGGDSINVLKLVQYLDASALTPEMVLTARTPERIAKLLSEAQKADAGIPAADTGERTEYFLTDSQMGVYLECTEFPEATMYNIPMCCALPADLDREKFKTAVKKAVAMHPAFGVNIALRDGTPVMRLHPEFLKAEIAEWETEDIEAIKKTFVRPFRLEGEPLYRMALYKDRNHNYFLIDVHHIIFDGTSLQVLLDEISKLYRGEEPQPEKLSLMALSVYEEKLTETSQYGAAREYFANKLGGEDFGEALIKDFKKKEVGVQSHTIRLALDEELSCMAVEQFARQKGISENTLFLGAFSYALGKYSGDSKSLFCTVNNGRHQVDMAESVGMFVRTLPVAQTWKEETPVDRYLQEFQKDFYEMMGHDCISFAELARDYGIASDIIFVYQGEMFSGLTLNGRRYAAEMVSTGDVQADVSVMVTKSRQGYEVTLEYRRDLYREETARGLLGMYLQVLKGMLSCENLGQIALTSELDLQVLDRFNQTECAYDKSKSVVDLIREQVQRTPGRTAVVYKGRRYTYAEVDDITDRLAAYIAGLHIGKEQVVSVLIPRCEYMPIAALGVSKAGAAYQPLDPSYPKERLAFMVEDADAQLLIADETLLELLPDWRGKVLLTKDILGLPKAPQIPEAPKPEDLFILLYTSGSTGTPKGCMLEHRNIVALCHWTMEYYHFSEETRLAAYASYGFDACMMDLYPTLMAGGELHIIEDAIRLDLNAIKQYFDANGITNASMTTQVGRTFATNMKCDSLKSLSMGGEALIPFVPEGNTRYFNLYGPTECTVLVTGYEVKGHEEELPIGKAISNVKLYILDSQGRRVPVGVPGELCVSGMQVSRGYLNRPEKTKEVYADNPFSSLDGYGRMYHTGDIVRFLPDGNIQFIGRRDGQVKIRGFRIELTEVEEVIRRFPGIQDATVAAFDDPSGGKYIAAYVVSDQPVDIDAMNAFIEASKPPYMVPAVTMQIDKIPLNQNQKVNKRALPVPERKQENLVMPETQVQQQIFDCVAEVIGHKEFGVTTDIYKAGLTSIGAVKLNVLLAKAFDMTIKTSDIKKNATIVQLEKFVLGSQTTQKYEVQENYPLTNTQMGVFVDCVSNMGTTVYNIPLLLKLSDKVDIERLKGAVEQTIQAHPYLKVQLFTDAKGEVRQHRDDSRAPEVKILTEIDREHLVRPYGLYNEPLYRFEIYQTAEGNYLFIDVHHLIADGTSLGILIGHINQAYGGEKLPVEEYTSYDAALDNAAAVKSDAYHTAEEFYRSVFQDCDGDTSFYADKQEETPAVGNARLVDGNLSVEEVHGFCEKYGITENVFFVGAFGILLSKYNAGEEAVFTTVYHGRNDSRLAETIGMLVKTLPVRCRMDLDTGAYFQTLKEYLLNAMDADIYPFSEISREYQIQPNTMLVYQGENFTFDSIGQEKAEKMPLHLNAAKEPVTLSISIENGQFVYDLEYRSDMFEADSIQGILESYQTAIISIMQCEHVAEVSILSPAQEKVLDGFNQTQVPYDREKTVVDLFREAAGKYPEHTAVVYRDTRITYGELDALTDRIGAYLNQRGLGAENPVAILVPRCEYMAVASLGVLKAGCAYQPLDPTYPKDRLQFMLEDSGTTMLIAEESMLELVPDFGGEILLTSQIKDLPEATVSLPKAKPEDLFILLYTSGSTGVPKGCMLEYGNITAFCRWYHRYYELTADSRLAAYASFGFDASMMDLFCSLTAGAQLHIIAEDIRLEFMELSRYFDENGITHSFMTTQVGRQFALSMENKTLKHLSVGGEKLVAMEPPKNYGFHNIYGPTECTVAVTTKLLDKYYDNIPIGSALDNLKLYIADKQGHRLPVGACGELLISGIQVSRGYLNRPEKTAEVFTKNPYTEEKDYQRMYHTGDIVRWLPDGSIQFVGRKDAQVKIRGFRIELTEVEEVIRRFPGIKDATVVAFDEKSGGKYIAAYVVSDQTVDIEAMNQFIMETKPPYMVPAVTMQIDRIPLNQNQKVNKRALPVPERKQEELVPPQNETQQKIFDCVAEVVGHKEFGVTTDIYQAGLTSIGAVKLNVLLANAFEGAVIRNKDLKENDTVEKLEKFLKENGQGEQFERQELYPLTQTQNGIFVECAANMGSTIYNIPFLFRLGEKVDLQRLKKAIGAAVEAHSYIKTTLYLDDNGDIWQKRNDDLPVEIMIYEELHREELVRPYQLLGERLFRIQLFDTPEGKYLFMEFHHIISDGESCGIFLRDINQAYGGKVLEKETFSGYEAALVEQKALRGPEYALAKQYYDSVFAGCDTDFLPAKDHREDTPGVGRYIRNEETDLEALQKFCTDKKITLNTLFTAAFGFVTGRYVYKDEAVFTTIYNGRNDSRLASTVNMLVKTLPVYCNLEGEKEIAAYLRETGEQLMNSMNADIYSFAEISRAYNIKADLLFAFQGDNFQFGEIAGEKAVSEELSLDTAKAPLSIDVMVDKENGGVTYQVEYRSDLYEERTVAGMIDSLIMTVQQFQEKRQLKEVSMVSSRMRRELESYNETDHKVEQTTANILFERQAALYPDKTAVIACGVSLTFRELNENANKIANHLLDMGLKIEQMVGVMLPRTVDVYAARQGILKAGGAFLPIDPEYPDERISYILEDSRAEFILMTKAVAEEHRQLLQKLSAKVLMVEDLLGEGGNTENPRVDIKPENLCYCIYTSGSTGKPKGVMIEHRNLVNYVDDNPCNVEAQAYIYNATCSLAFAAITFDVSILEECIPLYHGITVCMANEEEIHNPLALSKLILENGVDMMTCTPSFLINIIDMPEMKKALSGIKVFNVGAEAFPEALYDKIKALGTDAIAYNGYGPTETTIGCAFDQVTGDKITIGRPMANIKMVMIDKYRNLLPAGVPGELLIIGNGVGRGYVGKPELTADKFIQFEGRNAYRSGDLAKWNHHGKIEFMGRMDNQVKLRGLRVELDEIENVMNQYPTVKSSVVLVKEKDSNQFLCGYFVAASQVEKEKLTSFMQKYLTPYMVPSVLMQLPELPLTNNGKVDKRALPEPEYTAENKNYVKPQTELQRKLCEIFEMALGVDKIGIEDDFFANGGTSLSASKVAMKCMSAGIQVSYAELFDHKTPLELERLIQKKQQGSVQAGENGESEAGQSALERVLSHNTIEHVDEIQASAIGNVLLTGANGFLGAHILKNMIDHEDNIIYCLIRKGNASSLEKKLKNMLMYYFGNPYEELFGSRIRLIEGDITDKDAVSMLGQYDFARVINCAACVKHFSADDTLEQVNYQGVLNLIGLCSRMERELIQISTVSIAGENVGGKFPEEKRLHESELFFGQSLSNKYIDTKFRAEKAVLEAVAGGMKGKVIRVGNLMSRVSDGEFQINSVTNGFMRTLRGYVALGKFPVSMLDTPAEFSPIDSTAEAIVKLVPVKGDFSVFHAYSSYLIQMADVIEQMNQSGIPIEVVSDEEFANALSKALENEEKNELIAGLIAYASGDEDNSTAYIDADNRFTTKALYRLGFKWPMPDGTYLKNALEALETLGFFDGRI